MPQKLRQSQLLTVKNALLASAGVGLFCIFVRHRSRILEHMRLALDFRNPLRHKHIQVIETADQCQMVVNTLKRHLTNYRVLGFDCEWVTVGGTRRPVALLQLSSHEGLCALFRLCHMKQIPKGLRELLEADDIIKVGVGPQEDAQKLAYDFGVGIAATFDLRFLAAITDQPVGGLAKLSKSMLKVTLDKNWRLACSNWEAKILNEKQLHYAANDALVAVEIFKKLSEKIEPKQFWDLRKNDFAMIFARIEPFFDIRYKESFLNNLVAQGKGSNQKVLQKRRGGDGARLNSKGTKNIQSRGISTRSKTLYDNCLLEAPDGELLCTIDRKKAQWYLDQNLGDEVKMTPFTVRLNFEPAGRAVGDVGRYYQTPKENQCVVCGRRDAYIRKNVVPREYRKNFPVVMKSHTSHDVLLLCPECHQLSNIFDLKVRMKLAELCDAPITHDESAVKSFQVPELRQLKSAARALHLNADKIPVERREKLKEIVMSHYKDESELTQELLVEASNIDITHDNENYCQHGSKVVQKYQQDFGGLIELEKLWREHFIEKMKPKYLPALWNINHNANRLEIRAQEGRIEKQDLINAGLETLTVKEKTTAAPRQ